MQSVESENGGERSGEGSEKCVNGHLMGNKIRKAEKNNMVEETFENEIKIVGKSQNKEIEMFERNEKW